jgi:hypothetical protein
LLWDANGKGPGGSFPRIGLINAEATIGTLKVWNYLKLTVSCRKIICGVRIKPTLAYSREENDEKTGYRTHEICDLLAAAAGTL